MFQLGDWSKQLGDLFPQVLDYFFLIGDLKKQIREL